MLRFVRIRSSHARRFVPGWYCCHERKARAYVSCIRSSASSPGADQPTGDAVDLVAELERFLFEPNTVTRSLRDATCLGGRRCALAHPAATLATGFNAPGAPR